MFCGNLKQIKRDAYSCMGHNTSSYSNLVSVVPHAWQSCCYTDVVSEVSTFVYSFVIPSLRGHRAIKGTSIHCLCLQFNEFAEWPLRNQWDNGIDHSH